MNWEAWALIALAMVAAFGAGWEFAVRRIRKQMAERLGYELNDPPFLRVKPPSEAPIAWFFFAGPALVGVFALILSLALPIGQE